MDTERVVESFAGVFGDFFLGILVAGSPEMRERGQQVDLRTLGGSFERGWRRL